MRQFYLQWENPQTLSADSAAGISPEIFADAVCEIEFGRRAHLLAFLVSLRAATLYNGFESQAAL